MYLFLSSRAIENACSFFFHRKILSSFSKNDSWVRRTRTDVRWQTYVPSAFEKNTSSGIYEDLRYITQTKFCWKGTRKRKKKERGIRRIYTRYRDNVTVINPGSTLLAGYDTVISWRPLKIDFWFFFLFFFYFRKLSNQHVIIPENKNPFKRLFWREGNNDVCSC